MNLIGGLGGDDITEQQVEDAFFDLMALAELAAENPCAAAAVDRVRFLGIEGGGSGACDAGDPAEGGE